MTDDNPWTDDRARQSSLLEDDEALRTRDRSGETVTGSESFVDDRDGGGSDPGEQAGLFTEREEIEEQNTLGGGTATRTTEGVLEPEIDADRGAAEPAVDERRGVPETTNETLGAIATDVERESPTFDAQTGELDAGATDRARLELDPKAAEAGMMTARLAERRVDDLARDTLKPVREERADVRDGGGTVELEEDTLAEFSDAVADFGADASPAQRPEGFDVLEERVFEADAETERGFSRETVENVIEEGHADPETGEVDLGPETRTIEFGSRAAAQEAREHLPDHALTDEYDGRHATIEVQPHRAPDHVLDRVSGMAADSKAYEQEKTGQAPLSDRERREIDFTETTVPEARSAKAIFADSGVDDWLSFFDPRLSVDEQRELAEQATQDDRGKRMDSEESAVEKEARARRRTAGELERFARQGAEAGEEEAVRTLVDELGWSESNARALAQSADDPQTRGDVLDTVVARALSNGRFLREPPERAPGAPSKYRSQRTGRFVGDRIDPTPGIGRDPADGRFLNKRRF